MAQYRARLGDDAGLPIAGLGETEPDGLPTIEDYDELADLPQAYNELAEATQVALNARLATGSPSSPSATAGFRRATISDSPPTGGVDGDVWFQVL